MNETKVLVEQIVEGIQNRKGERIVIADLTEIGDTICKYFVICQGNSPTQIAAIVDEVREVTREQLGVKPIAVGAFYDLEHLWADAKLEEIAEN